jgi:putative regulator of septum formation
VSSIAGPFRRRTFAALTCALTLALTGCGWFGGGNTSNSSSESVFKVQPEQCFVGPSTVKAELDALTKTPCAKPHTQESYAIVTYKPPAGASGSAYPGNDLLTTFAQGACAQRYAGYVGVDYLDSSLFFTYLLPSPRSWEQQGDHEVLCFVTTTGAKLTKSVKGSRL